MIKSNHTGLILACSSYFMWGLSALYFKEISAVPFLEVASHRILWSLLLMGVIIHFSHKWRHLFILLLNPKTILLFILTACLLMTNWLLFIWAVTNNYLLDVSLGSFISPLFNVCLALIFFKERLRKTQWIAVITACIGILIQLMTFGSIPWIALISCISWGFYGLIRKKLDVDAQIGMFIEMVILSPFAFYTLVIAQNSSGHLLENHWQFNLLLMLAGVVTTLPLLFYNLAAQLVKFSTLGFIQYINPCIAFIIAVAFFDELLTTNKLLTFFFIWVALIFFVIDGWQVSRKKNGQSSSLPQEVNTV